MSDAFSLPPPLADRVPAIEEALCSLFPPEQERTRVEQAMAWSLLAGGKRLRPVLLLTAAAALGGEEESLVAPACAVECLHTYSLIHDDLPCMDDDDLRRGRATCHVRFDEATAVLAGDALHSLCFEILLTRPEGGTWEGRRVRAAGLLARAVGRDGMVLGQQLDLAATGEVRADRGLVERIHRTKTALLLRAALRMGGVYAGASAAQDEALGRFGMELGLVFQMVDDLLDVEGDARDLGKAPGGDEAASKATAVSAWGVPGAREQVRRHQAEAAAALESLQKEGGSVEELAVLLEFVAERRL